MKVFAILVVGLVCAPQIAEARWVYANGNSCDVVCKAEGSTAVSPGNFSKGDQQPYYICRADAHGEGNRTGYNLQPDWSNRCYIEWGGHEQGDPNYSCLCK